MAFYDCDLIKLRERNQIKERGHVGNDYNLFGGILVSCFSRHKTTNAINKSIFPIKKQLFNALSLSLSLGFGVFFLTFFFLIKVEPTVGASYYFMSYWSAKGEKKKKKKKRNSDF